MKKTTTLLILAVMLLLNGCSSVPITGRKQLNLVSDEQVLSSSIASYNSFMTSAKQANAISKDQAKTAQVIRVGQKIAAATEAYLRATGLESDIKNFAWEFNLVKSDEMNAWCMPGGKIVVYEGLMKIVNSDDDLAVVLGHEVAHAVAKHSNERMSQQVAAQAGAQVLAGVLSGQSYQTQTIAQQVYGLGAQYGVMQPFSRKHESEADKMGLVLMTIAGYNPQNAITFWQKMSANSQTSVPEFLSSHPSHETRIKDLTKWVPEVKAQYGGK
ncbi:MAG: M48 family metallopeptidase [Muribaculaceae bacterium]|nr:M48 family metallopeptidase [Muribaculaceae bacterium]